MKCADDSGIVNIILLSSMLFAVMLTLSGTHVLSASAADDKDMWCREGSRQRTAIDSARQRLGNAEQEAARLRAAGHSHGAGLQNLRNAQADVMQAKLEWLREEEKLADLERNAHERGVPLGWLNCRFEY